MKESCWYVWRLGERSGDVRTYLLRSRRYHARHCRQDLRRDRVDGAVPVVEQLADQLAAEGVEHGVCVAEELPVAGELVDEFVLGYPDCVVYDLLQAFAGFNGGGFECKVLAFVDV